MSSKFQIQLKELKDQTSLNYPDKLWPLSKKCLGYQWTLIKAPFIAPKKIFSAIWQHALRTNYQEPKEIIKKRRAEWLYLPKTLKRSIQYHSKALFINTPKEIVDWTAGKDCFLRVRRYVDGIFVKRSLRKAEKQLETVRRQYRKMEAKESKIEELKTKSGPLNALNRVIKKVEHLYHEKRFNRSFDRLQKRLDELDIFFLSFPSPVEGHRLGGDPVEESDDLDSAIFETKAQEEEQREVVINDETSSQQDDGAGVEPKPEESSAASSIAKKSKDGEAIIEDLPNDETSSQQDDDAGVEPKPEGSSAASSTAEESKDGEAIIEDLPNL